MLRNDPNGNPDFCRTEFTPVNPAAQAVIKRVKLETNALMALMLSEYQTAVHPEVQRLAGLSMAAFEEASMWATKALTSEHWGKKKIFDPAPTPQKDK